MLRKAAKVLGWGIVAGLLGILAVSAFMLGALFAFLAYAGF